MRGGGEWGVKIFLGARPLKYHSFQDHPRDHRFFFFFFLTFHIDLFSQLSPGIKLLYLTVPRFSAIHVSRSLEMSVHSDDF